MDVCELNMWLFCQMSSIKDDIIIFVQINFDILNNHEIITLEKNIYIFIAAR